MSDVITEKMSMLKLYTVYSYQHRTPLHLVDRDFLLLDT